MKRLTNKKMTRSEFQHIAHYENNSLCKHLLDLNAEISADYLFIASVDKDLIHAVSTAAVYQNSIIDNFSYELNGSPCEQVFESDVCCIPENVAQQYPLDAALVDMGIQAYLGVPIFCETDRPVGILVGLYKKPCFEISRYSSKFNTFGRFLGEFLHKSHLQLRSNKQLLLLSEVEEMAKVGAWEYDVSEDHLYWSNEVYRIYGLPFNAHLKPLIGAALYNEYDKKRISELFNKSIETGETYCEEIGFNNAQGLSKWIRVSSNAEKNSEGKVIRLYGAIADITEERKMLAATQAESHKLEVILNNLKDAVVTIDLKGNILHANSSSEQMFGYSMAELEAMSVNQLMPEPYASRHQTFIDNYERTQHANIIGVGRELPALRKNGEVFQMELSLTKASNVGESRYVGVIRDISERIQAEDTIYNLAYSDTTTGLKNKRWFERECKSLLQSGFASRGGAYIYAALINVDKMSQINLKYGFGTGNDCLKFIADKISTLVGKRCNVYKSGEDAFVLLSDEVSSHPNELEVLQAFVDSNLLRNELFSFVNEDQDIPLSVSIGSAILDARSNNYETLFDTLEYALRNAKRLAPFGQYYANKTELEKYERLKKMRSLLANVTETDELSLVIQPQFNPDGKLDSSEALIRWHSQELGWVGPDEFIPVAEQSNTINKIGEWVIDQVCQLLYSLDKEAVNTSISINISAKQIVASNFIERLLYYVEKWHVSPQRLVLELTETALITDIELVISTMNKLHKKGFRFSVDDFGTGYSSLSYLKKLPISELKIDRFFVDSISDNNDNSGRTIVNMIINMANALGVTSVAEGVETQEQLDYLTKQGCSMFQGYYLSKPLSIEDWLAIIAKHANKSMLSLSTLK